MEYGLNVCLVALLGMLYQSPRSAKNDWAKVWAYISNQEASFQKCLNILRNKKSSQGGTCQQSLKTIPLNTSTILEVYEIKKSKNTQVI